MKINYGQIVKDGNILSDMINIKDKFYCNNHTRTLNLRTELDNYSSHYDNNIDRYVFNMCSEISYKLEEEIIDYLMSNRGNIKSNNLIESYVNMTRRTREENIMVFVSYHYYNDFLLECYNKYGNNYNFDSAFNKQINKVNTDKFDFLIIDKTKINIDCFVDFRKSYDPMYLKDILQMKAMYNNYICESYETFYYKESTLNIKDLENVKIDIKKKEEKIKEIKNFNLKQKAKEKTELNLNL